MKAKLRNQILDALGPAGGILLNDTSLSGGRGGAQEFGQLKDEELIAALRGVFIGSALAWSDIQAMIERADKMILELASRRAPSPAPLAPKLHPAELSRIRKEAARKSWIARRDGKKTTPFQPAVEGDL